MVPPEDGGSYYTINGVDHKRVSMVKSVINKYGLTDWMKKMTLNYVSDVLMRHGTLAISSRTRTGPPTRSSCMSW